MIDPYIWDRKLPSAEYQLEFSFAKQLMAGEVVTNVDIISTGANVIVDQIVPYTDHVKFWVRGGEKGRVATLEIIAVTSFNEILSVETKMAIG